jgi:hypothetical protein
VDSSVRALPVVSFANLSSAKIVMASPKPDYYIVEKFFFQSCVRQLTQRIPLDEQWYLAKYPDVAAAIRNGAVADAQDHYFQHGYFENRMPYSIAVDATWYLEQNQDVREAVGRKQFSSAQEHFEVVGFREGRLPYPKFDLEHPVGGGADVRRPQVSELVQQ